MDKNFWGVAVWVLIHVCAITYKPENKHSFKQFIYALRGVLPCGECREHLSENLKMLELKPEYLSNHKKLFLWTFLLHDLVNRQLNKHSPSYEIIEQYYIKNAFNKKFWGPYIWRALHSMAAVYKPEYKTYFKQLVYSLPGILPCDECKHHLIENLKILPLTDDYLSDNNHLFLWTFLLHDLVNKQLAKESPSFEKIKSLYFNEKNCASCGK